MRPCVRSVHRHLSSQGSTPTRERRRADNLHKADDGTVLKKIDAATLDDKGSRVEDKRTHVTV